MYNIRESKRDNQRLAEVVRQWAEELFPIEASDKRIEVTDVKVDFDKAPDPTDLEIMSNFIHKEKTLAANVYVTATLYKNDKPIETKTLKIGMLPLKTSARTFIVNGVQYDTTNMLRLRSGVYTAQKENGEIETRINLKRGYNMKLWMNPQDKIIMASIGTSSYPLYAILSNLGVTDNQMRNTWGDKLFQINKDKVRNKDRIFLKFASKYLMKDFQDVDEARKALSDRLDDTLIDPETTKVTLGQSYEKMDASLLLRASKRLIEVMRDPKTQDNKDDIYFAQAYDIPQMLADDMLLKRQNLNAMRFKLQNRLNTRDTLRDIIPPNFLNKYTLGLITGSSYSNAADYTNPLGYIAKQSEYTKKGEGGIKSAHAITHSIMDLYDSYAGFIDPVFTPDQNPGVTVRTPINVRQVGTQLEKKLYNVKTKSYEWVPNDKIHQYRVAFGGEYDFDTGKWINKKVNVVHEGKVEQVDPKDVDYVMLSAGDIFNEITLGIPFVNSDQSNRAAMGAKMQTQAIPLKNPEIPLVRTLHPVTKKPIDMELSKKFLPQALDDGIVEKVTDKDITIKYKNGQKETLKFYKNHPLGTGVSFSTYTKLKPGQKIRKGDLLMDSDYTDNGQLKIGTNLTVAYMPYKSLNSEDGVVITESAARKLASEHTYFLDIPKQQETEVIFDLNKFKNLAFGTYSEQELANLDSKGVVKKGTILHTGDVYGAYLKKRQITEEEKYLGKINKGLIRPYKDKVLRWEKSVEGKVVDVLDTPEHYRIIVKTIEPAKRGDKLTGRHGNKGVITAVIPDSQAPVTESGEKVDAILSPTFIPKRINVGQILETSAGKVAAKTGKPVEFIYDGKTNNYKLVKDLLKQHGLKDKEYVIVNGEKTKNPVLTGKQYMLKLKYTEDKGFSVRGPQGPMSFDMTPSSGGEEGGKSIDRLTLTALMVHGAKHNMLEMGTYKAEDNPEFWRAVITGNPIPKPKSTFAYKTFMDYLKGAGVNPQQTGEQIRLMPMTDRDTLAISSGKIEDGTTVRAKDMMPEKGGLFDPTVTGGTAGDKWAHIELDKPLPNPIYVFAIKQVLGLSNAEYDAILSGQQPYKGKRGPDALMAMLEDLDVDKKLEELRQEARAAKNNFAKLNKINRAIRFLKNLKQSRLKPTDLMMKYVPVAPPKIRPIYPDAKGNIIISDLNNIYKDIIVTNNKIKEDKKEGVPDKYLYDAYGKLAKELERLSGVLSPNEKAKYNPQKAAQRGFLEILAGDSPKRGYIQRKVISKRQNLSGLGVVAVDPTLGMDEIGLPDKMAFTLFKPMIERELMKQGMSKFDAQKEVDNKTDKARAILETLLKDRHVLINRAPSLHKYSILAFKPKLIRGKSVKVPLLIVKGFNMDFDGDKVMVHVPVTPEANKEAEQMLPSRHIIHPTVDKIMNKPVWEDAVGLYALTQDGKKTNKKFKTKQEALKAYMDKKISETDIIKVGNKKTTIGRILVSNVLPGNMEVNKVLNKKTVDEIIRKIAKDNPDVAARTLDKLKKIGDTYITQYGMTLGLDDIKPLPDVRKKHLSKLKDPKDAPVVIKNIEKDVQEKLKNTFYDMANKAGVNVKWSQVAQMSVSPVMIKGLQGDIPFKINKSYVEGLPAAEYWASAYGGRRGVVSKTVETAEPGAFSKEIAAGLMDMVIAEKDCGTTEGIVVKVGSGREINRFPVKDIKAGGKLIVSKDQYITPDIVKKLEQAKVKEIEVRSPLTCKAEKGICQKCFGVYIDGSLPKIGDHVGALTATTLGEPLTQMAMRVFHTGSTAGSNVGAIGALDRIKQVTQIPKTIPDRAVISKTTGYVDKIEKSSIGGYDIHINNDVYHVPATLKPIVKKGDRVKAGDLLSTGNIHPYDIFETKGPKEAGRYVAEELTSLYHQTGVPVAPSVPEVVAKSMLRYGQVIDPKDSPFEPGDIVEIGSLERTDKNVVTVDVRDAEGYKLAEDTGGLQKGKKLTFQDVLNLINKSIYKVKVFAKKPLYRPLMIGVNRTPFYNEDWMLKTGFREIQNNIIQSAAKGSAAYVGGPYASPLTRYMYGPSILQKWAKLLVRPADKQRLEHPYMGTAEVQGLTIDIENMPGTIRKGPGWEIRMKNAYGEIRGTKGADGDPIDVFIGPNLRSRKVYIIHQKMRNANKYDEDKVMLGFDSLEEAKKAYLKHYDTTKYFYSIEEMSIDKFKNIYLKERRL